MRDIIENNNLAEKLSEGEKPLFIESFIEGYEEAHKWLLSNPNPEKRELIEQIKELTSKIEDFEYDYLRKIAK